MQLILKQNWRFYVYSVLWEKGPSLVLKGLRKCLSASIAFKFESTYSDYIISMTSYTDGDLNYVKKQCTGNKVHPTSKPGCESDAKICYCNEDCCNANYYNSQFHYEGCESGAENLVNASSMFMFVYLAFLIWKN